MHARGLGTDVVYTLRSRLGLVPLAIFFLLTPAIDAVEAELRLVGFTPFNRDYGEGFWSQQWLGLVRIARAAVPADARPTAPSSVERPSA